jgi:fatty-acid desaturase
MLTFGEGWHNNHHAHPQSARHGLVWHEFDLNWYGISALRMLGLARDIKLPRPEQSDDCKARAPFRQHAVENSSDHDVEVGKKAA